MRVTLRGRVTFAAVIALVGLTSFFQGASAMGFQSAASESSSDSTAPACGWATSAPTTYQHVIWIMFEDNVLSNVIGNAAAPYITNLAKNQCGYARGWLANILHSAPNYVPATAGANCDSETLNDTTPKGDTCITHGVSPAAKCTSNSCAGTVAIPSIFEQVQDVPGDSWKAYEEGMPSNCSVAPTSGRYYVRHNPAPYFSDLRMKGQLGGNTCASDDVSFPNTTCDGTSCTPATSSNVLANDLANNTLPTFSFVTPNFCDDMHTKCKPYTSRVTNGDQWLAAWLPMIIASPAYQGGTTAVFIMWEAASGTAGAKFGDPLPNVIVAPSVVPGTVIPSTTTINNIAALGATENMLGLGYLGCATGMQGNGAACPAGSTTNLRSQFGI
jgi:hypothetical protein